MASNWASGTSNGSFFNFTAWMGLIISSAVFMIHFLEVYQKVSIKPPLKKYDDCDRRPAFRQYPWHQMETIYSMIWTFFYLIASSCIASYWYTGAPTAFGFICSVLYLLLVR